MAGLGTGVVSSLFAPWAKWAVDKRQMKLQHRLALLTQSRDGLGEYRRTGKSISSKNWYQQLRPYLSVDARAKAEFPLVPAASDPEGRRDRVRVISALLAEEIDRVEREWKLNN
ncbi:hypothetical protein CH256_17440 [Rhodococcus sp. 05-2254-6]|nr:hypothetical protein CH256_17440 [Rhodococcus sp. 05-2254-6]